MKFVFEFQSSALARVNGAVKSASSKTPGNRSTSVSSNSGSTGRALAARKASTSGPSGGTTAGALDQSDFQKAFEDTQVVNVSRKAIIAVFKMSQCNETMLTKIKYL